jgi:hypothetical protein
MAGGPTTEFGCRAASAAAKSGLQCALKLVTNEKIGGSGVTLTQGT